MKTRTQLLILTLLMSLTAHAQVNSGSNGSDGAFNPAADVVINMADHPDGIYHYTSVYINARVTFIPNANNTPVVWLVQSNCVINGILGIVDVSGTGAGNSIGAAGGPGGWAGGSGGSVPSAGQGPGGGAAGGYADCASYGTLATSGYGSPIPPIYGNQFLVPLLGGVQVGEAARIVPAAVAAAVVAAQF